MDALTNSINSVTPAAATKADDFNNSKMNFRSANALQGFERDLANYDKRKGLDEFRYSDNKTGFVFPVLINNERAKDASFYHVAANSLSKTETGQVIISKYLPAPGQAQLIGRSLYFIRDTTNEEATDPKRNPVVLAIHKILKAASKLKGEVRSKPKQPSKTPKKATKEDTVERIKLELADKDNREVIPGLSAAVGSGEIEKHEFNGSNLSLRIASKSNSPHTRNTKFDLSISDRIGSPHENEEGKLSDRRLSAKLHATVVEGRNEGQAEDYILSSSNVKLSSWKEAKFTIPKLLKRFLFQKELELPK